MLHKMLTIGLVAGAVLVPTSTLRAEGGRQTCAAHEQVVATLTQKYGETRQSFGLTATNQLVEMFASRASGTWTIIVTDTNGVACLIAAGDSFDRIADQVPGAPA